MASGQLGHMSGVSRGFPLGLRSIFLQGTSSFVPCQSWSHQGQAGLTQDTADILPTLTSPAFVLETQGVLESFGCTLGSGCQPGRHTELWPGPGHISPPPTAGSTSCPQARHVLWGHQPHQCAAGRNAETLGAEGPGSSLHQLTDRLPWVQSLCFSMLLNPLL